MYGWSPLQYTCPKTHTQSQQALAGSQAEGRVKSKVKGKKAGPQAGSGNRGNGHNSDKAQKGKKGKKKGTPPGRVGCGRA